MPRPINLQFGTSKNMNNYMKEYSKQIVLCKCGAVMRKGSIPQHNKTKKHLETLKYLESRKEEMKEEPKEETK